VNPKKRTPSKPLFGTPVVVGTSLAVMAIRRVPWANEGKVVATAPSHNTVISPARRHPSAPAASCDASPDLGRRPSPRNLVSIGRAPTDRRSIRPRQAPAPARRRASPTRDPAMRGAARGVACQSPMRHPY
jgi:hypothetical protein